MCGTFTQIAGMALGLYATDMVIRPVFAGSELMGVFFFLMKGAVEFWIYKWFQCKPDGSYNRHALQGMSFMQIMLGGLVGGATLLFAGQLVGERQADDFMSVMVKYSIEAVILNFVFGAAKNMLTDLETP